MTSKKYKILKDDYIINLGKKLYRIKALKNFGYVKKGSIGGYVEGYDNLSQNGNCWIYENAKVSGNARIFENARVYNNAVIFDKSQISGDTRVYGTAVVFGNAWVSGGIIDSSF